MSLLSLTSLVAAPSAWSRGGGGGQPDPFSFNAHFELADDEYYLLDGAIVIGPAAISPASTTALVGSRKQQAYLRVNLEDQSWLANPHRVSLHGFYPIEGSANPWRESEGKSVKLAVRAHVLVPAGTRTPLVTLEVIPELSQISQR